jgi:hypothetical protein
VQDGGCDICHGSRKVKESPNPDKQCLGADFNPMPHSFRDSSAQAG